MELDIPHAATNFNLLSFTSWLKLLFLLLCPILLASQEVPQMPVILEIQIAGESLSSVFSVSQVLSLQDDLLLLEVPLVSHKQAKGSKSTLLKTSSSHPSLWELGHTLLRTAMGIDSPFAAAPSITSYLAIVSVSVTVLGPIPVIFFSGSCNSMCCVFILTDKR